MAPVSTCLSVAILLVALGASEYGGARGETRAPAPRQAEANETLRLPVPQSPAEPAELAPLAGGRSSVERAALPAADPGDTSAAKPPSRGAARAKRNTPAAGKRPRDARRFRVLGWTEGSFTASTDAHQQLPMGFNYRANQFLLQQNWLRLERAAPTDGPDRGFGFMSDTILPGTDYRFTLPVGLLGGQLDGYHGQPDLYGIDPVRLYAEAYLPNIGQGTHVKIGRFYAQYGVEAIDAPSNSLVSHSYTFIYNPFTQIGVIATTKLNDGWTVQAGMTSGSDFFTNPASSSSGMSGFFESPTFIGSLKWESDDKQDDVKCAVILGPGRYYVARQINNLNVFDIVWNHRFNENLTYTLDQLYGYQRDVPQYGNSNWLGIVQYLTYRFREKASGTLRLEFFDDFQGQRTGYRGLYTDITAGLQLTLAKRLTFRPELRFDHNDSRPFEHKPNLFTATTDVIFHW